MLEQVRRSTINLGGSIHTLHVKHAFAYSTEPHWHEEFSVGLIDSGFARLNHDRKTEHITTDKVIIVNPGEAYSASSFGAQVWASVWQQTLDSLPSESFMTVVLVSLLFATSLVLVVLLGRASPLINISLVVSR